jgi:hypothetical protein
MKEVSNPDPKSPRRAAPLWRALVEVGFIVFLYYSNLLMGEYERSGQARAMGLSWALADIATGPNLAIAIATALVGYVVIELLRRRF